MIIATNEIGQETVDFVKSVVEKYCQRNNIVVTTHSGNKGFPQRKRPTNQLHCVLLRKERCSWQYPGLNESGHFYSGLMIILREMPDEHGPDYIEMTLAPDHGDRLAINSFPALDLTYFQEELNTLEKWPGLINAIEEKLRLAMVAEESSLKPYKKQS